MRYRLVAMAIIVVMIVTISGCGSKESIENKENIAIEKTDVPGKIGTLDEVLAGDKTEATLDDILESSIKTEETSNIVVTEKREDVDKQSDEIKSLENYKVDINLKTNIQIDDKKSDSGIKEVASQTGSINLIIISIYNIDGDIPTIDVGKDEKIYKEHVKTKDGVRYTIYTPGNLDINSIEFRIYNNEDRTQYRVINMGETINNLKDENGEVIYGDIIKIDNNLFTLLGIKELKSNWIDGSDGGKSIATRVYRLELQNLEKGPQRVLNDNSIKNIKAVDKNGNVYKINTDILTNESNGSIKFSTGYTESSDIITKYTLDNKEYIDINIEITMSLNGKTPREEVVKADTIIRETASKMFIAYESDKNYWVTSGFRY